MKIKNLFTTLIITTVLLTVPYIAIAATPNQQLMELLGGFHSMQANFMQTMVDGANNVGQHHTAGHMALQRPGKFYWQVQVPSKQLIIADGKNIWLYDAELQQATKQKMDLQQQDNPAMLLSGSMHDLSKQFHITRLADSGVGEWFELKPKAQHGMFQIIQLHFIARKLVAMHIVDNLGQHIVLTFSNIQINPHLNPALFAFKPPAGVDMVGN